MTIDKLVLTIDYSAVTIDYLVSDYLVVTIDSLVVVHDWAKKYCVHAGLSPDLGQAQGPRAGPSFLITLLAGAVFHVGCLSSFRALVL